MNMRLRPPTHSVPDNVWHTLFILLITSWFVWQTGEQLLDLFVGDNPVVPMEQQVLQNTGPAFQTWLNGFGGEKFPLLPGRILAFLGWMFALGQVIRTLKPQNGFVGALPAWLILFTLPGFSVWMCAAGSASWSVYFFIKGFATLNSNETQAPLIRSGVYLGIALLLQGIWVLPVLGILLGCWEVFRYRLKWVSIGLVASVFPLGLLIMLLDPEGLGRFIPGPGVDGVIAGGGWFSLVPRYLFLVVSLVVLLVYGWRRRGVGWWSLVFALPLLLIEPLLASTPATVLMPLWIFLALGLSKVPAVLDLRFPRAYQSVLLCQLLLWVPTYLGHQPKKLYAPITQVVDVSEAAHE